MNPCGDLVCPACGANLITPPGHTLVAGRATCLMCSHPFEVSRRAAKLANERAAFFATRRLLPCFTGIGGGHA